MRIILEATFPNEPFNTLARKGTVGQVIQKIMEAIKPEAAYFTDNDGCRSGLFILNLEDASKIPTVVEPLLLGLNAKIRLRVCMTPEDLGKSGIDQLAPKW